MSAEHMLVRYFGTLGSPDAHDQTWSCNLRVADISNADYAAASSATLDTLGAALLETFQDSFPGNMFTDSMWLSGCQTAPIDSSYHYAAEPHTTVASLTEPYGTTTQHVPFQIALVLTLRHIGVGRGNYGRIYLPVPGVLPQQDGLIEGTVRGAFLDGAKGLVDGINTASNGLGSGSEDPSVAIIKRGVGTSWKAVGEVGVGLVLDTQRRRRDKLVESIAYEAVGAH